MSRSYRKPYIYVCGVVSSHSDKTVASRSYRRLANSYTRDNAATEDFLIPDRREANHNDPWGWNRDGGARPVRVSRWMLTQLGIPEEERSPWRRNLLAEGETIFDDIILYSRK